jgi:hypothetical protein
LIGYLAGTASTGAQNTFVGPYNGTNGSGAAMTSGAKNTILGGFNGNQGGLDIRTLNNNIVLSDGDGYPQFYIRYLAIDTAPYRLRNPYHSFGYLFSSGTVASGSSVAQNVNGTGQDGSIGLLAVVTRWTSVDGGDSVALYTSAHGNSYNDYTLLRKVEVNSITINESSGTVTISNGSANEISYEFVYLNYGTGEITRVQY